MMHKIAYCFRTAFQNIKNNLLLSCIAISTIAITFIICLIFFTVLMNLAAFKQHWISRLHVIVYLQESVTAEQLQSAHQELLEHTQVESVTVVTQAEALEMLKAALQGQDGILEGLTENPLPPSLDVRLKSDFITPAWVEAFVADIRDRPYVDDIEYGQRWLERFMAMFEALRIVGLSLAGCLLFFSYFIVANTIKLMVYSRRTEIEIMKLIGATNLFIRLPFWIEGFLHGVAGAGAALLFMYLAKTLFLGSVIDALSFYLGAGDFLFLPPDIALATVLLGAVIGLSGSLMTLYSLDEFNV
jgi:cell division transport system permease protein